MNIVSGINVAALTGGWDDPASRFRFRQYFPGLAKRGIDVIEHVPFFEKSCGLPSPFKICARIPAIFRSRDADIVWISRELVQGYETFERLLKRPRVMDVDDAIWLSRPFGRFTVPDIAREMDAIVAGNNYLADYFSKYCKRVYAVPTAIDLDRYQIRSDLAGGPPENFVIGWTGLASNYKYLKLIEKPLKRFLQDRPNAQLFIVAERPWKSKEITPERIVFIQWRKEIEATALKEMSVGVMPLPDDKWTLGKCSFKMLQYMAVGLPVVVSPVGMNNEVLAKGDVGFGARSDDEWYEALDALYRNESLQIKLGTTGRKIIEQYFSVEKITDKLADILKKPGGV